MPQNPKKGNAARTPVPVLQLVPVDHPRFQTHPPQGLGELQLCLVRGQPQSVLLLLHLTASHGKTQGKLIVHVSKGQQDPTNRKTSWVGMCQWEWAPFGGFRINKTWPPGYVASLGTASGFLVLGVPLKPFKGVSTPLQAANSCPVPQPMWEDWGLPSHAFAGNRLVAP